MKICPNCSAAFDDRPKFCSQCGTKLPDPVFHPLRVTEKGIEELPSPLFSESVSTPGPSQAPPETPPVPPETPPAPPAPPIPPAPFPAPPAPQAPYPPKKRPRSRILPALLLSFLLLASFIWGISLLRGWIRQAQQTRRDAVLVMESDNDEIVGTSRSGRLVKLKSTERIDSSVTAPDGTQILFNDTGKRLWLFDGKRFTHLATDIKHFLFSFDGKTIAYIDQEDTLFLSRNGKPTRVASQVSPLIRLSPDGKAVAYVREEGDSLKAFYYDGREHEIAREAVPAAISAQGRYVYYYSSKGVLYVQKGSNTDLRQKLVDQVEHLCLNASGDQILVSDGTYTYFSEKGGERIKLSSQSLSLLPASGVAMSDDGFYGAQDLKGLYYQMCTEGGTTVYQLNRRLELGSLLKNTLSPSLQPDGKTLIFSKNENLYYMNLSNTDRGEIKLADRHRGFCVSRDGKHVLFLNEEGETWFVTLGQSARRITADTVEIREAAPLENSFVFELEGVLYFTNGNRSSKVSGLSDDVKTVAGSGFWILAECQNGEVFLSTNGKSFTRYIRK